MDELKLSTWTTAALPGVPSFDHRKKVLWLLITICSITMIPLAYRNYTLGYNYLGASLALFITLFIIDFICIQYKSLMPIHYSILVTTLVAALLLTIFRHGLPGLFWMFPVSISLILILPSNAAYIFNSFLITGASILSYKQFGLGLTIRYTLSLIFSFVIVTVTLNIIRKLSQKLKAQSFQDPLTGALNRRQLFFFLDDCLKNKKTQNTDAAIVLFDIDLFKQINDDLGHAFGDMVIKKICSQISENINKDDLFFRIGGDEFLLLTRNTNISQTIEIANSICRKINAEPIIEQRKLSVSIGIANIDNKFTNIKWMDFADQALYQAKKSGRNCVRVYEDN